MLVLTATAVPAGLRGDLTKWLAEISPGVFVGDPSARVRDLLWERTTSLCRDGRAILVYSAHNEQGYEFRVHNAEWTPCDFDGISLIRRPAEPPPSARRTGWSNARMNRRGRKPRWAEPHENGPRHQDHDQQNT